MKNVLRASFLIAALLTLIPGIYLASPARATGEITVVSDSHQIKFPNEIVFTLSARGSAQIQDVTLNYKFSGGEAGSYARPTFSSGKEVTAQYNFDTQKSYIPPGTDVTYSWAITDAAGNKATSDPVTFTYEDNRLQWQSVSEGPISVHYYKDQAQAKDLLAGAAEAVRTESANLRVSYTRPMKIYVYDSRSDMLDSLPKRSATYDSATVTLGVQVSPEVLLLLGSQSGVKQTMFHEIMHMIVGVAAEGPYAEIPTWLNEGLAMWSEGAMTPDYKNEIDRAIKENRLLSIRSLTSFPGDPSLVNLSYGESWSIVTYMIDTYGMDKMADLMAVYKQGSTTDKALNQVYGFNTDQLDANWRASIGAPPVQQGGVQGSSSRPQSVPTLTPFGSQPQGQAGSSGNSGILLDAVGVAVLVVAGGGAVLLLRRRRKAA